MRSGRFEAILLRVKNQWWTLLRVSLITSMLSTVLPGIICVLSITTPTVMTKRVNREDVLGTKVGGVHIIPLDQYKPRLVALQPV